MREASSSSEPTLGHAPLALFSSGIRAAHSDASLEAGQRGLDANFDAALQAPSTAATTHPPTTTCSASHQPTHTHQLLQPLQPHTHHTSPPHVHQRAAAAAAAGGLGSTAALQAPTAAAATPTHQLLCLPAAHQ